MRKITAIIATVIAGFAILVLGIMSGNLGGAPKPESMPQEFTYTFNTNETLLESSSDEHSASRYWWVDSGAKMITKDGIGMTIQGSLFPLDKWRLDYAVSNPTDTDGGFHPQNIFRLVTRNYWHNVRVETQFKIVADNFSGSKSRNGSNGVLLMTRYLDGDTLYYGGLRVDGTAVIKKKYKGDYYTMAQKQIISGSYDRDANSDLLPHDVWFGVRMDVTTDDHGIVHISIYKNDAQGQWINVLQAIDDGKQFDDTPPIDGTYRIGIRTDFMDVQFKDFHAQVI